MAVETIELNSGSGGALVAVDTVSTASYQLIKLAAGGDGNAAFAASTHHKINTAGTDQDQTSVSANPTVVYSIAATSVAAAAVYFKLYNDNAPTSADTPIWVCIIPPSSGFVISFPHGINCPTACGWRLTTGIANNDANAATTTQHSISITYVSS